MVLLNVLVLLFFFVLIFLVPILFLLFFHSLEKVVVVVVIVGIEAGERVKEHSHEVHWITARGLCIEDDVEHQEDGNMLIVDCKSHHDVKLAVWIDQGDKSADNDHSYDGLCRGFQENYPYIKD